MPCRPPPAPAGEARVLRRNRVVLEGGAPRAFLLPILERPESRRAGTLAFWERLLGAARALPAAGDRVAGRRPLRPAGQGRRCGLWPSLHTVKMRRQRTGRPGMPQGTGLAAACVPGVRDRRTAPSDLTRGRHAYRRRPCRFGIVGPRPADPTCRGDCKSRRSLSPVPGRAQAQTCARRKTAARPCHRLFPPAVRHLACQQIEACAGRPPGGMQPCSGLGVGPCRPCVARSATAAPPAAAECGDGGMGGGGR